MGLMTSVKTWGFIILVVVGISLYSAHKFIVAQKDDRISSLEAQVSELTTLNIALEFAQQENLAAITKLETEGKKQTAAVRDLTIRNQEFEKQRDNAVAIFNNHNFTLLSRAKPGLIERRVRSASKKVFDDIEQDSRDIWKLLDNEIKDPANPTPSNNAN